MTSLIFRRRDKGMMLPRGYGIAWVNWEVDEDVCLPVGLNVIAALMRALYFSIRFPKMIAMSAPDAYAQGLRKCQKDKKSCA
jgi:hypothetical protein